MFDPKTGHTYRIWRGIGQNGTEVEFLVRAFGIVRRTRDKDRIGEWFDTDGSSYGNVIDCGPVPTTLPVMRPPGESLH